MHRWIYHACPLEHDCTTHSSITSRPGSCLQIDKHLFIQTIGQLVHMATPLTQTGTQHVNLLMLTAQAEPESLPGAVVPSAAV